MAASPLPVSSPRIAPRDALLPGAVILVGLVLVFRGDLLTGSDFFFKATRDISPFLSWYPWSRLAAASWAQGLFPLWNPYNFLGLPLLGNYQSSVFSPLLWPLYLPLDAVTAPYLVGRLWLAGMGAWWLGRRVGQSNAGATVAGVAFGLTGYLVQHVNVQHVVIDLLIPYLIIAGMEMLDRPRMRSFLALAGVTALILLGGQPGAALFTFFFGYGFLALYALAHPGRRLRGYLLLKAAGGVAGLIAMIQLLPFFEFIPEAWTFHLPGFGVAHIPLAGISNMVSAGHLGPLEPAQMFHPLIKIPPYIGISVIILAVVAAIRSRRLWDIWLVVCLVVGGSILFGLPPLYYLATIPGIDRLTFIKYFQTIIAFCFAMLAGKGLDEVSGGKIGWKFIIGLVVFFLAIPMMTDEPLPDDPNFYFFEIFKLGAWISSLLFLLIIAVIVVTRSSGKGTRNSAAYSLLILALIELVLASAVNRPLMSRNVAREDFSPQRDAVAACTPPGAPIPPRAAATEDLMLPAQNLLVPYFEIGGPEALIPRPSYDLIRAISGVSEPDFVLSFLKYNAVRGPENRDWNAAANIAGLGVTISKLPLPHDNFLKKLSDRPLFIHPEPDDEVDPMTGQVPDEIKITNGQINGDRRESLFAHSPLHLELFAPPKVMSFSAGIDPRVTNLPGDGVWFVTMDYDRLVFSRYLDPRQGDGGWVDATATFNRSVALITLPNASIDNDWAWWGDLRPATGPDTDRFIRGVHAYCDQPPAPRIYLAKKIVAADTLAEMLNAYAPDTAFVPPAALAASGLSSTSAGGKVSRVDYGLQRVTADLAPDGPGLLVLADAYFPGWRAFVDGREQRILRANHAVRGVAVAAGSRQVEFVYEPWSFRVGLWLCLAGLTAAVIAATKVKPKDKKNTGVTLYH